jgi:ABC-type Fe3+-siderophore transport system permease subunit
LLLGGAFLAFCDTLGRTVIPDTELPVGFITALLGGPFLSGSYSAENRDFMRFRVIEA